MLGEILTFKLGILLLSASISIGNLIYYLHTVFNGQTRPHIFSWLIWGIIMLIAGLAQYFEGGGAGAFVILVGSFVCFARAIVGLKYGEKNITLGDKLCLASCLIGVIFWQLTDNPLYAVLIITFTDLLGFYPTVRKSFSKPYSEELTSWIGMALVTALSLLALETYNFTTVFYPLVITAACWGLIIYLLIRRKLIHDVKNP